LSRARIAIIGTGGIARSHVRAVKSVGERAELVAAVDVDGERAGTFCKEHGIPASYAGTEKMLSEERPDLALICTPPGSHKELSVRCLEAGAWVLCEKPLCASLAEMDEIEAAEKRTGNYCASVFQWRFGSGAEHLKGLMEAGELGRPLVGLCNTTWYRDDAYYAVPWRGRWETELGGPTMGHGIHVMDLFLWLLGDWAEVRAMMGTLDRDIEVEDVSMALVRFENGAMGSVVNSVLSPRQETDLRLDFQKATVELTGLYGYRNESWRYSVPGEGEVPERWRELPEERPSSHASQLERMLESMERGERPQVSGPDVRPTIEFLTCLYKSAITGEPVRRGSVDRDDPFYHRIYGEAPGHDTARSA
jgi:predicted dehydrogenase